MSDFTQAKRRIEQSTFDEAVTENIEDLEMEPNEAILDAIKQFESQGVDLTNIDKTGGVGREEVIVEFDILKKNKLADVNQNQEELITSLKHLQELCNDTTHEYGLRNQNMMNSDGGMNACMDLLTMEQININANGIIVLSECFKLLTLIIKKNIELRDFFEPGGSKKLIDILNILIKKENSNKDIIECTKNGMTLCRIAARSENNKFKLFEQGGKDVIVTILQHNNAASLARSELTSETCLALKSLCVHDDIRREMSCAMDNGKAFIKAGSLKVLLNLATSFQETPDVASSAMAAAKQLVTSEEAVVYASKHGAMTLPLQVLSWEASPLVLLRSLFGLMRNLCADDNRKSKLASEDTLPLMVARLSEGEVAADAVAVEHGFACLAAMSLRCPNNSLRIVQSGAMDVMVKGMDRHQDKVALQRQACLTARNIAARCPELRPQLLDAGLESRLRAAGRYQDSVDEAYGALRDLGCEVTRVKIDVNTGTAVAAVEEFGKTKSAFKAVYDDTDDIETRVQDEAVAPFSIKDIENMSENQNKVPFASHEHEHGHAHGEDCGC